MMGCDFQISNCSSGRSGMLIFEYHLSLYLNIKYLILQYRGILPHIIGQRPSNITFVDIQI